MRYAARAAYATVIFLSAASPPRHGRTVVLLQRRSVIFFFFVMQAALRFARAPPVCGGDRGRRAGGMAEQPA